MDGVNNKISFEQLKTRLETKEPQVKANTPAGEVDKASAKEALHEQYQGKGLKLEALDEFVDDLSGPDGAVDESEWEQIEAKAADLDAQPRANAPLTDLTPDKQAEVNAGEEVKKAATPDEAFTELSKASDEVKNAEAEVKEADKKLAVLLAHAGKGLTKEQQEKLTTAFHNDGGKDSPYSKLLEARGKLAATVEKNQDLFMAAVTTPVKAGGLEAERQHNDADLLKTALVQVAGDAHSYQVAEAVSARIVAETKPEAFLGADGKPTPSPMVEFIAQHVSAEVTKSRTLQQVACNLAAGMDQETAVKAAAAGIMDSPLLAALDKVEVPESEQEFFRDVKAAKELAVGLAHAKDLPGAAVALKQGIQEFGKSSPKIAGLSVALGAIAGVEAVAGGEYGDAVKQFTSSAGDLAEVLGSFAREGSFLSKEALERATPLLNGISSTMALCSDTLEFLKSGRGFDAGIAAGDLVSVAGAGIGIFASAGVGMAFMAAGFAITAGFELIKGAVDESELEDQGTRLMGGLGLPGELARSLAQGHRSGTLDFVAQTSGLTQDQLAELVQHGGLDLDDPGLATALAAMKAGYDADPAADKASAKGFLAYYEQHKGADAHRYGDISGKITPYVAPMADNETVKEWLKGLDAARKELEAIPANDPGRKALEQKLTDSLASFKKKFHADSPYLGGFPQLAKYAK